MNSATIQTTYKNEAGTTVITSEVLTGDLSFNVEHEDIPAGATNVEVDVYVPDELKVQCFAIGCKRSLGEQTSKNPQFVVKTNNALTPDDTFPPPPAVITSTTGYSWHIGVGPVPITVVPITKLFIDNVGDGAGDIQIRFLIDSTP